MKSQLRVTALTDLRDGRRLFTLCFILYCMVYIGRLNLSAAITEITTTGILEKDSAGLIGTAFFVVYAAGQLINGFLSDRMSPFFLIGFSIGMSAAVNLVMFFAMYLSAPLWCYILIWAANGYAQSAIYPTLIRMIATVLPEPMRISAGANLFASTAVGTMCANLISASIMKFWSWQFCFLAPAILLGTMSLSWFIFTAPLSAKSVSRVESEPALPEEKSDVEPEQKKPGRGLVYYMAVSGAFIMMIPIGAFAVVKESVTVWSPTLLTEVFSAEPSFTVAISTVISLAAIFGAVIARTVLMHWLRDEMKTNVFFYLLTVGALALVLVLGMRSLWSMLILLSLVLILFTALNTVFMGVIPLRFGRYGLSSTVTGVLNAVGAAGNAAASYLTGLMAKTGGWNSTIVFWLALSGVGALVTLLIIPRWMRFKRM